MAAWPAATWALAASSAAWALRTRARSSSSSWQAADVHARQWLAGLDEGALVDQDGLHAPGQLGGHIDLGGLDAAIAADEAFARPVVAQHLPGHQGCYCNERPRCTCRNHPFFPFLSDRD
jgi:hypothetical protein